MFIRSIALIAMALLYACAPQKAHAAPVAAEQSLIALYQVSTDLCDAPLDPADPSIIHDGLEISGLMGADSKLEVQVLTTDGWQLHDRAHTVARVDGTLANPHDLTVKFGQQFWVFIIQSSEGVQNGLWRIAVTNTSNGSVVYTTPVASTIAGC